MIIKDMSISSLRHDLKILESLDTLTNNINTNTYDNELSDKYDKLSDLLFDIEIGIQKQLHLKEKELLKGNLIK